MGERRVYGTGVGQLVAKAALLASARIASAAELVEDPGARRGAAVDRVVVDDADLVLLLTGEQGGEVEPCGCADRPLGGLFTAEAYVHAVEGAAASADGVWVLNVGGWLDATAAGDRLTVDAVSANSAFLAGLRRVRLDAANVGWTEVAALGGRARPGMLSANVDGVVGVVDHLLREVAGRRVLVTGVTRAGRPFLWPEGATVQPAAAAVAALIARVPADVVVVLVHDDPQAAVAIAALPGVDLVVEGAGYRERWAPDTAGGAVRVRTWTEGARLTELRLWLDDAGIHRLLHRTVDLDEALGSRRRW